MTDTFSGKDREDLIDYRLSRAEETLKEADFNASGEYYNAAVNRLYYAVFYATNALLLSENLNASTHAGAKTLFSLHFIRTGKLDPSYAKTLSQLYENRQSGDYEDFVYCDRNMYEDLRPQAAQFIAAVQNLINESRGDCGGHN